MYLIRGFAQYVVMFIVAVAAFDWLVRYVDDMWTAIAIVAAIATIVAATSSLVQSSNTLQELMVVAGIILFWSFCMFGAEGTVGIGVLFVAGAVILVGVAIAIADLVAMIRRTIRGPR